VDLGARRLVSLRANIHDTDAAGASFRQNRRISGGNLLKRRLLDSQMSLMESRDDSLMLLRRGRYDVHIRFKPCAHNAAWIAISGAAIQGEVLRADLQQHLIFFEPNACGQLHGVTQLVGVPAVYFALLSAIEKRGVDLRQTDVNLSMCGGAALPAWRLLYATACSGRYLAATATLAPDLSRRPSRCSSALTAVLSIRSSPVLVVRRNRLWPRLADR